MVVDVTIASTEPTAEGHRVTVRVVVTDDAPIDRACDYYREIGDRGHGCIAKRKGCSGSGRIPFGRWTPPPKEPDRYEASFAEIIEDPGTYEASFRYTSRSARPCPSGENPYDSKGSGSATFVIPE